MRRQNSLLLRTHLRRTPLVNQPLDPGATVALVKLSVRANRALVQIQNPRDLRHRQAVVKQQQNVHPSMNRAVRLTAHHRKEIGSVRSAKNQSAHAQTESHLYPNVNLNQEFSRIRGI
jgi:hypothetical protein